MIAQLDVIEEPHVVSVILTIISNRYLPVVFHNLRGYDSHLIVKEVYNLYPDKDLSIIPNSYEKFMSFKMGTLKFIDSF